MYSRRANASLTMLSRVTSWVIYAALSVESALVLHESVIYVSFECLAQAATLKLVDIVAWIVGILSQLFNRNYHSLRLASWKFARHPHIVENSQ
jgi:hypothetical protein